jgi:hypothetical protein
MIALSSAVRATIRHPDPAMRVSINCARPALNLHEQQTGRAEYKQINLVDTSVIVDELEVRPRAPGVTIGQMLAEELQSLAFPLVGRWADNCPTRRLHAVLALVRLILALLGPPARFVAVIARSS